MSDEPMNGVAEAELRSFVERIERLQEEKAAIGDDIKDVYGEAYSRGYDKTALGQVVTARRKRSKDAAKFTSQGELFDLYMTVLDAPSHTHARVRAA